MAVSRVFALFRGGALFAAIFMGLSVDPGQAEKNSGLRNRHALIIGNEIYETERSPLNLINSVNDANTYEKIFKEFGWNIFRIDKKPNFNLNLKRFNAVLFEFYNSITAGSEVVFVYSGHGLSKGGENFLVPTDASLIGEANPLNLKSIFDIAEQIAHRGPKTITMIIDACRNISQNDVNHERFVRIDFRNLPRAQDRGANRLEYFIVYASSPGEVAYDVLTSDDRVENSVFTRAFATKLKQGGTLRSMFDEASMEVETLTREKNGGQIQQPVVDTNFYKFTNYSLRPYSVPEPLGEPLWIRRPMECRSNSAVRDAALSARDNKKWKAEKTSTGRECIAHAALAEMGIDWLEDHNNERDRFKLSVKKTASGSQFGIRRWDF